MRIWRALIAGSIVVLLLWKSGVEPYSKGWWFGLIVGCLVFGIAATIDKRTKKE